LTGVVTVIGANLTIFAVPVQIYALTQSSAYVGLFGVFALVPLVVFGLWGGAWADAMDRYRVSVAADQPDDLGNQQEAESYDPVRGRGERGGEPGPA
jgi:hypothetical protein